MGKKNRKKINFNGNTIKVPVERREKVIRADIGERGTKSENKRKKQENVG